MDQAIVPIVVIVGLFIITLVWLFFLISGRENFNFNVDAFGIKVAIRADKGDSNESTKQNENS